MKPKLGDSKFGWIEVGKTRYDHDIVIELDGTVRKRKKKLSKATYGTSHCISQDEAEDIYEPGAQVLLVGTGVYGRVELSREAQAYFAAHNVTVQLYPTPEAAKRWNDLDAKAIGLFHVTC